MREVAPQHSTNVNNAQCSTTKLDGTLLDCRRPVANDHARHVCERRPFSERLGPTLRLGCHGANEGGKQLMWGMS